jgi:hypothetical protein
VGSKPDLTACNGSQTSTESTVSIMTHQNEDPSVDRKKTHIEILKTRHEACMAVGVTVILISRIVYPSREVSILVLVWILGAAITLIFLRRFRRQTSPTKNRRYGYVVGSAMIAVGVGLGVFSFVILSNVSTVLPHFRGATLAYGLVGVFGAMKGIEMLATRFIETSVAGS